MGRLIGYRVRFEEASGPDTRLLYVTSGVLLRRILHGPELAGVSCIVIDEFHERHLDTDLVLAMAIRAQQTTRADLSIVVMSATLDGERIKNDGRLSVYSCRKWTVIATFLLLNTTRKRMTAL